MKKERERDNVTKTGSNQSVLAPSLESSRFDSGAPSLVGRSKLNDDSLLHDDWKVEIFHVSNISYIKYGAKEEVKNNGNQYHFTYAVFKLLIK